MLALSGKAIPHLLTHMLFAGHQPPDPVVICLSATGQHGHCRGPGFHRLVDALLDWYCNELIPYMPKSIAVQSTPAAKRYAA